MRHEKRLVRTGRLGAVHVTPDERVVDLSRTRRRGHGESTVRNGSSTDSAGSITETETGLRSLSMCTLILFELRVLALFSPVRRQNFEEPHDDRTELPCRCGALRHRLGPHGSGRDRRRQCRPESPHREPGGQPAASGGVRGRAHGWSPMSEARSACSSPRCSLWSRRSARSGRSADPGSGRLQSLTTRGRWDRARQAVRGRKQPPFARSDPDRTQIRLRSVHRRVCGCGAVAAALSRR